MSINHTLPSSPKKTVLEMTDEEIKESYGLFFPNGQPPEPIDFELGFGEFGEFRKLSFLKDVPTHYSANSQTGE